MPRTPELTDQQLLAAYRATTYSVAAPGRTLFLRVDQFDAQLAKLLREAGVEQAALLTAWNPRSKAQAHHLNEASQAALVHELAAAGYPCLTGRNVPTDSASTAAQWTEASVLAMGLPLTPARELAARYGQLAFVWIDHEATPRLLLTAAPTP